MLSKINCLLIGYGNIAKIHSKYLDKCPNVDWVWYDPYIINSVNIDKKIQKLPNDLNCFDKIFVLTPESTHYDVYKLIKKTFKKHIFIEKPAAIKKEHLDEILSDENVTIGMVERFNPAVQTLKSSIEKDKIVNIDFNRCCASVKNCSVSTLEDIGIHDIDLLFFLLNADCIKTYSVYNKRNTIILNCEEPLSRIIWSKDTYFKERKIIVRQTNCTYQVDLQEQSVVKHFDIDGHHVIQSLFVEKSSPIENELSNFLQQNPKYVDCRKSHNFMIELMKEIQ